MAALRQFEIATTAALADLGAKINAVAAALEPRDTDSDEANRSYPEAARAALSTVSLSSLLAVLGSDFYGDGWADFFDLCGDAPSVAPAHASEAADAALHESLDVGVLAAASRALAAVDPARAKQLLPSLIERASTPDLAQFYSITLRSIFA